jgi:hypothetical protein
MKSYLGRNDGYGWHISALKIYDRPRELGEFGLTRAPQSWQYIHEQISKDETLGGNNGTNNNTI